MSKPKTQTQLITRDLMRGQKITAMDALHNYGCWRLSARIADIRDLGIPVETKTIATSTGKHVAQYSIPIEYRKAMRAK